MLIKTTCQRTELLHRGQPQHWPFSLRSHKPYQKKPRSQISISHVRRPRQRKASKHRPRSPLWSHWLPPERGLWSRSPLQAEHRSPDKLRCSHSLLGERPSRRGGSATFLPSRQPPAGMSGAERSADQAPPAALTATRRTGRMVSEPACKGNMELGETTALNLRLLGAAGRALAEGKKRGGPGAARPRPPANPARAAAAQLLPVALWEPPPLPLRHHRAGRSCLSEAPSRPVPHHHPASRPRRGPFTSLIWAAPSPPHPAAVILFRGVEYNVRLHT